jgi:hypothetical protein
MAEEPKQDTGAENRDGTDVPPDRNPKYPNLKRPWKKGETGNPGGPKKKTEQLRGVLARVGHESVALTDGSGKMSRFEIAVRVLWKAALATSTNMKLKLEIIRFIVENTEGRPFTAEVPKDVGDPDEILEQLRRIHESCGTVAESTDRQEGESAV